MKSGLKAKPKGTPKPPRPENPSPVETKPSQLDVVMQVAGRFQRFTQDIVGVLFLAFALMTLVALPGIPNLTGGALHGWGMFLRLWLGFGSILIAIITGVAGFMIIRRRPGNETSPTKWGRIFALEVAALTALMLITLIGGHSLERAERGLEGGRIGWGMVELLRLVLLAIGLSSIYWCYLIIIPIFLVACLYGFRPTRLVKVLAQRLAKMSGMPGAHGLDSEPAVSMAPITETETTAVAEAKKKRLQLPAEFRKKFRLQPEQIRNATLPPRAERLPPLDLLVSEASTRPDERNINLTAGLIEKTLSEFGIPAKVVGFKVGPTVTQFAVEPGFVEKPAPGEEATRMKVRVAQISSLQRDLSLSLAADRLRIEAPVPGRPYIGIEVPNTHSTVVRLRPLLEAETFYKVNSPLAIAFGRDVSGQPVVADLTSMPHLLIAGTTGSGKSVCIAALTTCLVMNNTPEDLRLVMIDPKMVELVRFNGLPHLFGKVETNLERILGVLRWTVAEMDRRYKLLEGMHARHLDSYNRKVRRHKGGEPLPRIVLMIDELADLMMSAPDQTEPALVRLAQLARATGIHLVVATQRPSTDVVTGLIKANFPARISFAMASSVDSRVILDSTGAESLLGRGDMLFMPPEAPAPIRAQGVMVTDQEVERVISFWQQAHTQTAVESPPWEGMLEATKVTADRDDLVVKALEVVKGTRHASASLLQRRLRVGYPRAARLIDELEEMGIIGPSRSGGREREVLIEKDPSEEENKE